jgi:hypothetical protein
MKSGINFLRGFSKLKQVKFETHDKVNQKENQNEIIKQCVLFLRRMIKDYLFDQYINRGISIKKFFFRFWIISIFFVIWFD